MVLSDVFVSERCGAAGVAKGGGRRMLGCDSARVGTNVFENDSGNGLVVLD